MELENIEKLIDTPLFDRDELASFKELRSKAWVVELTPYALPLTSWWQVEPVIEILAWFRNLANQINTWSTEYVKGKTYNLSILPITHHVLRFTDIEMLL